MASPPKRAHPSLLPPGLREIKLPDLGRLFLGPAYDTPLRRRMVAALRMFIGELKRLGVNGELWINGSFATKKPAPGDIDLALFIPRFVVSAMTKADYARLRFLSDKENKAYVRSKWHVDLYVLESSDADRREYFLDLFSRNPDGTNRKGIPFLNL